jgi:hypothetical protein
MGQTVCFGCSRVLDQEDDLRFLTKACDHCFPTILSSLDGRTSDYLESLDVPAALLSREQVVLAFNRLFKDLAPDLDVVGLRIGEVLDCMYSPLLGRCGQTATCLLCKLKRSVDHTSLTGEGLLTVPFSFPHKAEARRTFTITTEKVGDAVLLLMAATIPEGSD